MCMHAHSLEWQRLSGGQRGLFLVYYLYIFLNLSLFSRRVITFFLLLILDIQYIFIWMCLYRYFKIFIVHFSMNLNHVRTKHEHPIWSHMISVKTFSNDTSKKDLQTILKDYIIIISEGQVNLSTHSSCDRK